MRYPRLVRLASWSDEIFTSLLLILETSQLRRDSALLSESFYSLRRSPILSFQEKDLSSSRLSSGQILVSVLLSVLIPHVKARLDSWHSNATGGAAAELFDSHLGSLAPPGENTANTAQVSPASTSYALPRDRFQMSIFLDRQVRRIGKMIKAFEKFLRSPYLRRLVLKWYPRLSTIGEGINLLFNLMYLFGHTKHFTLSLAIQRLVLRRASTAELLSGISRRTGLVSPNSTDMSVSRIFSAASERVITVLKAGFFASIFAFRFLQYYYAAEASMPREAGPIIAPPEPLQPIPGIDRKIALTPGLCPICHKPRTSPTACVTSGYLFCYLCIVQHVQQTPTCPITLAPTRIDDLIRVYDDVGSA